MLGSPPRYGAGADQVVAALHVAPSDKGQLGDGAARLGDIDRAIIEWRSLLRQINHAPELEWPRWGELQKMAGTILAETESPTLDELPSLEHHQKGRDRSPTAVEVVLTSCRFSYRRHRCA